MLVTTATASVAAEWYSYRLWSAAKARGQDAAGLTGGSVKPTDTTPIDMDDLPGNDTRIEFGELVPTETKRREAFFEAKTCRIRGALAHSAAVFLIPLAGMFLIFPALFWWCMGWLAKGCAVIGRYAAGAGSNGQ